MAAWLADRVTGAGSVLATDIDVGGLSGLHQANLTVARHDLEREETPSGGFDLIHARLVLEHLREPAAVVDKLAAALRAGGWLLLEDADGLLFDAEPAEKAFAAARTSRSPSAGTSPGCAASCSMTPRRWPRSTPASSASSA
jgi:SAM-dependent methyltransferase